MLALLLALTVTQAPVPASPTLSVLISRRTGMTVGRGIEIGDGVAHALEEDGIGVTVRPSQAAQALAELAVPDTASCEGHPECLSRIATLLHTRVVVGVDLAQVEEDVAVHLLAVPAGSDLKLADSTFVLEKRPEALARQLLPFARQLKAALETLPLAQATPGAPPTLTPRPAAPSPAQVAVTQGPPSRVPLYLSGAGTVVFAGLGAGFLAVGLHQKGRLVASEHPLPQGPVVSDLTADQARSLRDVANRDIAIGVTSAAVAAGLAALTGYLWAGAR